MSNTEDADAVIRDAAREVFLLDAEIKELTERRDTLKSFFKGDERFAKPGKYEYDDFEVQVTTNQRVSDAKAKRLLSSAELTLISVPKVDAKKARAYLSDEELAKIMDVYDHRITIVRKDDRG